MYAYTCQELQELQRDAARGKNNHEIKKIKFSLYLYRVNRMNDENQVDIINIWIDMNRYIIVVFWVQESQQFIVFNIKYEIFFIRLFLSIYFYKARFLKWIIIFKYFHFFN